MEYLEEQAIVTDNLIFDLKIEIIQKISVVASISLKWTVIFIFSQIFTF